MKARIRKNQKDWHVYIFWILLGVFALLVIMDAFSEDKFDRLPFDPLFPAVNYTSIASVSNYR